MNSKKRSIFSFDLNGLRDYLTEKGFARYASDQIYDWIYRRFEFDMSKWSNVSKKIKADFIDSFSVDIPTVEESRVSTDGTVKFLLKLFDGQKIECVAIPHQERITLCVSSQVGCAIGCTFCYTATEGFVRNLASDEIIGQYLATIKWFRENRDPDFKITNVVFMGQGEPLHNFENVKTALEILAEPKGIGLGYRKITVSTSGLVPQIKRLVDFPPVNLAISLHAGFDDIRSKLMPINDKYDLGSILRAVDELPLQSHRNITYEYLLIKDLNDRLEDANQLMKILDRERSKINLIPFNEYPGSPYKRPSDKQITWFKNQFLNNNFVCTLRISKGDDILAACGQLKGEKQ